MSGAHMMLVRGPATSAWTPASLANLFAWYDTSDYSTITESGGAVSQWNDKSGNARHISQATAANKPTYSATALAGTQPGFTYDGGDWLENLSISLTAATLIHAWAVIRPTGTKSNNRVVAFAQAAGFDYSGGYIPIIRNSTGDTWASYNAAFGTSSVTVNADNTAVVGAVRTNSTNYFMIKNGTESSTVALGFPSAAQTRLGIGAAMPIGGGGQFRGVISEVIIVAGATPSSGERAAIQSYLAAKWTLT